MEVNFILPGMKTRRCTYEEFLRIENMKRNLDEHITIYKFTDGKLTFKESVWVAAGTKVQEVAGDVQTDEAEHGKSTLTASVLAAAGTKVQEVAGDVQTDEAEHGISKSTLTDSVLADAGTEMHGIADDYY